MILEKIQRCTRLLCLSAFVLSSCTTSLIPVHRKHFLYKREKMREREAIFFLKESPIKDLKIIIDLKKQRASFLTANRFFGFSSISSGKEGFQTPKGVYKVTEKDKGHRSSLYGDLIRRETQEIVQSNVDARELDKKNNEVLFKGAEMPYFLRFHGSFGIHAGKVYPFPASHGCIRLPKEVAEKIFKNASLGTPVIIR